MSKERKMSAPPEDFYIMKNEFGMLIDNSAEAIEADPKRKHMIIIFNGSSVLGTVGVSMVDGVKITGINILPNNQVSVNLIHITPTTKASLSRSVTVSVLAVPISHQDIMSIIATASNMTNSGNNAGNPALNAIQGYGSRMGGGANANTFNPFSFLSNIQMGSNSLVNANWNLPQTVVMGLTGSLLPSSAADFIIVTVIPYTGASTTTTPQQQ